MTLLIAEGLVSLLTRLEPDPEKEQQVRLHIAETVENLIRRRVAALLA